MAGWALLAAGIALSVAGGPVLAGPATADDGGAADSVRITDAAGRPDVAVAARDQLADPRALLTTAPIAVDEFLVGALTWDEASGLAEGTELEVRVREREGWSGWIAVDPEGGPDGEEVAGTAPVVTGGADAVQVRVTGPGLPRDLRLETFGTPGTSSLAAPRADGRTRSAESTALSGGIYSRAEWGLTAAEEAYTDANWTPRWFTLEAAVVHHTAGSNTYSAADSPAIVKAIWQYHTGSRGWGDIGYNYLVDKYGQVFEGRKFSLSNPEGIDPAAMIEAGHALGYNKGSLGISVLGDFTLGGAPDPATALAATAEVIAWRFGLAGIADPYSPSAFISPTTRTRDTYPAGTNLPRIFAHGDVAATACPGGLYDHLGELREAVAADLAGGEPAPVDTTPPAVVADPAGGTYPKGTVVRLTADEPATVYWTTNGREPSTSSASGAGPVSVTLSKSMTIKYFAVDAAGNRSATVSQSYVVTGGGGRNK